MSCGYLSGPFPNTENPTYISRSTEVGNKSIPKPCKILSSIPFDLKSKLSLYFEVNAHTFSDNYLTRQTEPPVL